MTKELKHKIENYVAVRIAEYESCNELNIEKEEEEFDAYLSSIGAEPTFQQHVQPWMLACFGAEIAADKTERNHRFLEEALELVQATGCTAGEAYQLVDYVYGRPVGDPPQEVGGVKVTLAALCLAHGIDMHSAAETELARIWTKVEQIRAKQAAKPKHSPLPEMVVMVPSVSAELLSALKASVKSMAGYRREMHRGRSQPCDAERLAVEAIARAESIEQKPEFPGDTCIATLPSGESRQFGDRSAAMAWLDSNMGITPALPLLKPNMFRELVNDLRDLAKQYHGHDSLRDRISGRLAQDVPVVGPCGGHTVQLPDPLGLLSCTHPDCGRYEGPRSHECRAMADNACARPSICQGHAAQQEADETRACETCGGRGEVGGFVGGGAPGYETHPCPDCRDDEVGGA